MLLLLVAVPVIFLVACAYSTVQAYAPTNVMVRHVRSSRPTLRMAAALGIFAIACASAAQQIRLATEAGAPGWLNLVILVLAWDAIKFAVMSCMTWVRFAAWAFRRARIAHGRPSAGSLRYSGHLG